MGEIWLRSRLKLGTARIVILCTLYRMILVRGVENKMKIDVVNTYTATIYVGLKNRDNGVVYDIGLIEGICQNYCDKIGLCVTVTPTKYIYTNGNEHGAAIGLINYPRFPDNPENIRTKALELAEQLLIICQQYRISIVFPYETVMLSNDETKKIEDN